MVYAFSADPSYVSNKNNIKYYNWFVCKLLLLFLSITRIDLTGGIWNNRLIRLAGKNIEKLTCHL